MFWVLVRGSRENASGAKKKVLGIILKFALKPAVKAIALNELSNYVPLSE